MGKQNAKKGRMGNELVGRAYIDLKLIVYNA
jgi:hypothetical protein